MSDFVITLICQINHMSLYLMNLILLVLLSTSAAASVFYIFSKLLADMIYKQYAANGLYMLMRAAILFLLLPAGVLAVVTIYTNTSPIWGFLEPNDSFDVITYNSSSGVLMIWNRNLNIARFLMFVIWLCGFLSLFIFRLVRELITLKKIRTASIEWKDKKVLETFTSIQQELGIRRNIHIYQCSFIASPFSTGILHPSIFFPDKMYYGEELYFTLKHELVHCKRKDVVYHLLMMLLRAMHWYNPMIGFWEKDFFHYSEMSCDEIVLEHADSKKRYRYAKLLLEMIGEEGKDQALKIRTGFIGRNEKEAEMRMLHIMKGTKKAAKPAAVFMAACFAVLCPAATLAATQAVYLADGRIAKTVEYENAIVEEMHLPVFTEYAGYQELTEEDILDFERLQLIGRSLTNIDVSLTSSIEVNLLSASLKEGNSVIVLLSSNNKQDSFLVGIKDQNGARKYIYSTDGFVSHSFSIDKNSDYIVYVKKIKAADGKKIKINGSINICK